MPAQLTQFKELLSAVKKFGIYDFSKQIAIKQQIENFKKEGLDSNLSDIFQTDNRELFILLKDGSIRKLVIHIVDISSYWHKDWPPPKFHIYKCEQIEKMEKNKKKHRYKISGRKDGTFFLIKKDKKGYEPLKICSYCLRDYNNDYESNKTKQTFKIKDYLDKNFIKKEVFKTKMDLDICTVPNQYSSCWPEISRKRKEQENYRCEKCHEDLSKNRKFLHTHHIDSNKRNNIKENLKVLCIKCHAEEPDHSHIKTTPQYKEFVKKRKEGVAA